MQIEKNRAAVMKLTAHILSILMIFSALVSGLTVPGYFGAFEAEAAAVNSRIKQGDTLILKGTKDAKEWKKEYIVLNPTMTNTGDPGTFLLQKDYSEKTAFIGDLDIVSNEWEDSDAQKWCLRYYVAMPDAVKAKVIGVKTNETESGGDWSGVNNIDGTRDGAYQLRDKVFFLSYIEYDTYKDKAGLIPGSKWLLRTPYTCGEIQGYVCIVDEAGKVSNYGPSFEFGARPAFNINLSDDLCITHSTEGSKTAWELDFDKSEHTYSTPAYTWSDDNKKCTAEMKCSVCDDVVSETVKSDVAVTKEATDEADGERTYTASFTDRHFEKQIKTETFSKGQHFHSYGEPVYRWTDDNSKCTAEAICTGCGDSITESADSTSSITKEASWDEDGVKTFTASFENDLFTAQSKNEIIPKKKDEPGATDLKPGDHIYLGKKDVPGYTGLPYWRVLDKDDDGYYLLMSEYLWTGSDKKDFIQFNTIKDPGVPLEGYEKDGYMSKGSAWQESMAQAWCKGFENAVLSGVSGVSIREVTKTDEQFESPDMLTGSEEAKIIFARTKNILNKDKVFFLSAEEATKYMPTPADRLAYLHDGKTVGEAKDWWLRSPRLFTTSECAGKVFAYGSHKGMIGRQVVVSKGAVRPAFWARLEGYTAAPNDDSNTNTGGNTGGSGASGVLSAEKAKAKNDVKNYRDSKNNSNYDAQGIAALDTAKANAYKAIEAAKTQSEIDKAVANARKAMDAVAKKKAQAAAPAVKPGGTTAASKAVDSKKAADGTAVGKGASAEVAEKFITSQKSDNDPKGSSFGVLQLRSEKQTNSAVTLKWSKVKNAGTYVVYGNACGKNNKMKKLQTLSKNSFTVKKIGKSKLKKGTYHKFIVVALDKNKNVLSTSKVIHVATKGGKVGNHKSVTTKAKKNKVTIKKGKSFKLAGKAVAASKKLKVKKHRIVAYESSNPNVAAVSAKGVIKAKKKGTCFVYAYAQNGVFRKIKVTVK